MVDAITAVAASAATSVVKAESSLSITSEPDNKWVAERQSKIDADQVTVKNLHASARNSEALFQGEPEEVPVPLFEGHSRRRNSEGSADRRGATDDAAEDATLSGESERIGSTNFDDETPFGHRIAII
jgi:hypothetical protein